MHKTITEPFKFITLSVVLPYYAQLTPSCRAIFSYKAY